MNREASALPNFLFLIANAKTCFYYNQEHPVFIGLRIFTSSWRTRNSREPMAYRRLDMHMLRKMYTSMYRQIQILPVNSEKGGFEKSPSAN